MEEEDIQLRPISLKPFEQGSETNAFIAGAAGIASGLLKIPEGIFSLTAELIDMGLDTNKAADVEKFFDKINPFEEVAKEIEKMTVFGKDTIGSFTVVIRNLKTKA